jgi:hypothetical protein
VPSAHREERLIGKWSKGHEYAEELSCSKNRVELGRFTKGEARKYGMSVCCTTAQVRVKAERVRRARVRKGCDETLSDEGVVMSWWAQLAIPSGPRGESER